MSEKKSDLEGRIETTVSPGGASDTISIAPPEWEDDEGEVLLVEEEVSYKDMTFPEGNLEQYRDEILNMVGSSKGVVARYLDELKEKNAISDYVVMPVGAVHTLELKPGVVSVLVGSNDEVISIEVS